MATATATSQFLGPDPRINRLVENIIYITLFSPSHSLTASLPSPGMRAWREDSYRLTMLRSPQPAGPSRTASSAAAAMRSDVSPRPRGPKLAKNALAILAEPAQGRHRANFTWHDLPSWRQRLFFSTKLSWATKHEKAKAQNA